MTTKKKAEAPTTKETKKHVYIVVNEAGDATLVDTFEEAESLLWHDGSAEAMIKVAEVIAEYKTGLIKTEYN